MKPNTPNTADVCECGHARENHEPKCFGISKVTRDFCYCKTFTPPAAKPQAERDAMNLMGDHICKACNDPCDCCDPNYCADCSECFRQRSALRYYTVSDKDGQTILDERGLVANSHLIVKALHRLNQITSRDLKLSQSIAAELRTEIAGLARQAVISLMQGETPLSDYEKGWNASLKQLISDIEKLSGDVAGSENGQR